MMFYVGSLQKKVAKRLMHGGGVVVDWERAIVCNGDQVFKEHNSVTVTTT